MENEENVMWLINSDENVKYNRTYPYRCVGVQDFLEKLEKKGEEIVGIAVEDNIISFIVK